MTLAEQIQTDIVVAMKARDDFKLSVLRMVKSAIQLKEVEKLRKLDDAESIQLLQTILKQRKESIEQFTKGNRPELAEKEGKEAEILAKYLPAQMSEADLVSLTDKFLADNQFTAKDFGAAMGKLKAKVGDQADGATLAKILKEKLK